MSPSKYRRFWHWLVGTLLGIVGALSLALAATQLPSVRARIAREVFQWLGRTQDLQIWAGRIERLDPWGFDLHDVVVQSASLGLFATAEDVSVSFRPRFLLEKEAHLANVRVHGLRLKLSPPPAQSAPSGPSTQSAPSAWRVRADQLELQDALCQLSGLGPELEIYAERLRGRGTWGPDPMLKVDHARMQVTLAEQAPITITSLTGDYAQTRGGPVAIQGSLGSAPFALTLQISPWNERSPWYLSELRLRVGGVSRETLEGLGLGESVPLKAHVDLGLAAQRSGEHLEIVGAAYAGAGWLLARAQLTPDLWQATFDVAARPLAELSEALPNIPAQGSLGATYQPLIDPRVVAVSWKDLSIGAWDIPPASGYLRVNGPDLHVQDLRFQDLRQAFALDFHYQTETGALALRADFHQLRLAALEKLLPKSTAGSVDGELELQRSAAGVLQLSARLTGSRLKIRDVSLDQTVLNAALEGEPRRPRGTLNLAVTGVRAPAFRITKSTLQATSDGSLVEANLHALGPEGSVQTRASAHLEEHGSVSVTAHGDGSFRDAPFSFQLGDFSKAGEHLSWRGLHVRSQWGELITRGQLSPRQITAEVSALRVPLAGVGPVDLLASVQAYPRLGRALGAVSAWTEDGSESRTEASLRVPGRLESWEKLLKEAELSVRSSLRLGLDAADAELQLGPKEGHLRLSARDPLGELLQVQADLQGELNELVGAPSLQHLLGLADLSVSARLAPRDMTSLQGTLARLAKSHQLELPLRARGELELKAHRGQTSGTLRLLGALDASRLDSHCKPESPLRLALDADLRANELVVDGSAAPAHGGGLSAKLRVPIHMHEGAPQIDSAASNLHAQGRDLSIADIPFLCVLGSGRGSLELDARHLLTRALKVEANVTVDNLDLQDETPARLTARARVDEKHAALEANLSLEGRSRISLNGRLPLSRADAMPKLAENQPIDTHLRVNQLPVGMPLRATGQFGRAGGSVSADVEVNGTLRAPRAYGFVAFDDISFSVASLAQPFRKLNGRLELKGDSLIIPELSASDRGGKVSVSGKAKLSGQGEGTAKLQLKADRFPLRQQGIIMGRLTMRSELTARLHQLKSMTLDAQIAEGRVDLENPRNKQVQSLDAHPDVHLVSESKAGGKRQEGASVQLTGFELHTQRDLRIQHRDFSVQVGLDLAYVQQAGKPQLFGAAHIHRGSMELFGKSLTILRGEIRFTGELPADPEFDLRASYAPGSGQEQLVVQVSGRASNPVLSFSGAAGTPDEALAVLSGTNATDARNTAQANAQSLALGITAGILSMTARRELGEWVPMVSVTSSSTNQTSQASAGFNATSLIPDFMRGFARGAYVEGVVGPTTSTPGSNLGLGVRLEIALPRNVISRFTYGPGTSWSSDVVWTP